MNAQQLKNSILQMAVQGKLVPQDPNDEPASVLLERIQKEKEQLIKEGRIKKEKNPSYIFRGADNTPYEKVRNAEPVSIADEIPFEIPDSWEWCRLGNIFYHNTGKALNASNQSGQLLEYITTSNLYWNRFELDSLRQMYFTESEIDKCTVTKGDLLVCEGGDIGRAAIWPFDYDIRIQNHIHRLRAYVPVCTEYYYYIFYLYKHVGKIGGKGIGIQGLSANALHSLLFPLPPIEEQQRIVKKISEIRPYTEKYESVESKLTTLNNRFPDQLKKSILQIAVQGKLVPQDPNDEPASVLLERIRTEKEQMIKDGKIKRDKSESIIFRRDNSHYEKLGSKERCIDDEIPFELPDSWIWARLGTLISLLSGQDFDPSGYNTSERGIPYITGASNIEDGKVIINRWTEVPKNIAHSNELLLVCKGAGVGKMAVLKEESVHIARQIMSILPIDTNVHYLEVVLKYNLEHLRQSMQGVIPGISRSDVLGLLCPVPPLSEQERIVKQLKMILTMVKPL